jgi:hypothetical protein
MPPKKSKLDIKTELFAAYQEYLANFYPKDPNVYVIRAHPVTVHELQKLQAEYQVSMSGFDWVDDGQPRFLAFRLQADTRLSPEDIMFGPEIIDIKWSR